LTWWAESYTEAHRGSTERHREKQEEGKREMRLSLFSLSVDL
jgi:hypothetical protein